MFKTLLKIIAIILIVIALIYVIVALIAAAIPSVVAGTIFAIAPTTALWIAAGSLFLAYIVDPEVTQKALDKAGEAAGSVATSVGNVVGDITGGLVSGVASSPVGLILIGLGAWFLLRDTDEDPETKSERIKQQEMLNA